MSNTHKKQRRWALPLRSRFTDLTALSRVEKQVTTHVHCSGSRDGEPRDDRISLSVSRRPLPPLGPLLQKEPVGLLQGGNLG